MSPIPRVGIIYHRTTSTLGPRNNNSLFSVGSDFVVPLWEGLIFLDGKRLHFCVGDLDTLLIALFYQPGTDTQTRTSSGRASILEDGFETIQWAACPVFAEFTEQAVLNRIPFRRPGWIMRDGDGKSVAIA